MKIASFNLNGIRAAERKGLKDWVVSKSPDILCFQEVKAEQNQIDTSFYEEVGYHIFWHSAQKKGYSGVAIFSKEEPSSVRIGVGEERFDTEGRFILAEFENFNLINSYFPSGTSGEERQNFKYEWLTFFYEFIQDNSELAKKLILCGDINICHQDIDIHNPKIATARNYSGFQPKEREWIGKFLEAGFLDAYRYMNPDHQKYSWWSYRAGARQKNLGWRIDYFFMSTALANYILSCEIQDDLYFSDHCPVILEISQLDCKNSLFSQL